MLRCAMEAPSWKNSQTARYHVITSSTILQAMKQEGLAPFNAENTKDAPVLIVTSFVKDVAGFDKDGTPSNELGNLWGAYDLGLHNENLLLKARDLVLSTSQRRKLLSASSVSATRPWTLRSQSVRSWTIS